MKWSPEAEHALKRVPFFVRRRVRKRVDEEARRCGAAEVELEHLETCRRKFLENMESEVAGYRVETCFGTQDCPNRAVSDEGLADELEERFRIRNLKSFLRGRVQGSLKPHHEFCVTLALCPNACSRPQIVDVGLVGVTYPRLQPEECQNCGKCREACRERAVQWDETVSRPSLLSDRCLGCGECVRVCPSRTLAPGETGFRVLLGGKLGRHPQLGTPLETIYGRREVPDLLDRCLDVFMRHCTQGQRFGEILAGVGLEFVRKGF